MAEAANNNDSQGEVGEQPVRRFALSRMFWAFLIGLAGSVFIWWVTPYNNFIIGNGYISDSYLPVAALFFLLAIVWVVNPLLRWLFGRFALDYRQLAMILGMMLMASVLPGQGLLRMLPGTLAATPRDVRTDRKLAESYKQMDLPPSLYPAPVGYGEKTPVSDYFLGELPPNQPMPWGAWLKPLLAWGTLLLFIWLMVIGLGLVVFPQWRRNERLPFPLLTVQQALIEDPGEGRLFAPLFRTRGFWLATIVVLVLHILSGWHQYNPQAVPAIPLKWSLANLFTEEPLVYLPLDFHTSRLYFIFLGIAFFIPSRIGFSIWFFMIAYSLYRVIGTAYFPPYQQDTVADHRVGAMVVMAIGILWLGKAHWVHVGRCMMRFSRSDEDRRDQRAGWMFLIGCVGMAAWLMWVGVPVGWALFFVLFGFVTALVTARIVAETGMPFFRMDVGSRLAFLKVFPTAWLSPVVLLMGAMMVMFFTIASRVSAAVMATHAIGLDAKGTPRHHRRMAYVGVVVLMIGLVVGGGINLYAQYHHGSTLDGAEMPVAAWGTTQLNAVHSDLIQLLGGNLNRLGHNSLAHMGFGAGLTGFLLWMCLLSPRWPLHPIGLLMVFTFYGNEAWVAVLLGWLLKTLILRYGGARLYRTAQPAFLGMMIGEVLGTAFWSIVPGILALRGLPYIVVQVQPM